MRSQHTESQTASVRPNYSEIPTHTYGSNASVISSHIMVPSYSQQRVLLQDQQQQRFPISGFQNPSSVMQTGPVRNTLLNSNLVSPNQASLGFKRLLAEMRTKHFDSIRFAAYRTASKLRFIQQRTLFNVMDLWKVVETFREFGLHQLNDPQASLDYASTFRLLSRIYSYIPSSILDINNHTDDTQPGHTVGPSLINVAAEILFGWLVYALDLCATGRFNVNGLKVALSTLTYARPADKFRYHFTLLSDPSGALVFSKFEAYLQDLLKLPISVFEGLNFYHTLQATHTMFTGRSKNVVLEEFLDRMLSDQGPQVLVWLTVFHRLSSVENVRHNVRCEGCKREQICGLRYKCTRCPHYNLCQDCFWVGVTTDQHTNAHDVKEYSAASKSHSRQFGHSLRKSFQFGRSLYSSVSSGFVNTASVAGGLSERQKLSGINVTRRPHVGSIFEWNSGPAASSVLNACVNGCIPAGQLPTMPLDVTASISVTCSVMQPPATQRNVAPVNSLCSPLPNRRLQQLNPLFMLNRSSADTPNVSCIHLQPTRVSTMFNQINELSQGSNNMDKNVVAGTFYPNAVQQQDVIPLNYIRSENGMPYSDVPYVNQYVSDTKNPPSTSHQPLSSSSYPEPVTYLNQQYQQQQEISSATAQVLTTQTISTTSISNNSSFNANTKATFSMKMHNMDQKSSEEHALIARYAAQLAAASSLNKEFDKLGDLVDSTQTQKQLIAQLQEKNRKILREIERLRIEQQKQAAFIAATGCLKNDSSQLKDLFNESPDTLGQGNSAQHLKPDSIISSVASASANAQNPRLVADLKAIRQRKDELESRMNNLQRSRTDLMLQLEALVRLLSVSTGLTNLHENNPSIITDPSLLYESNGISRNGHGSRLDQKSHDYPPRRSTSLCHPSVGRNYSENFRPAATPEFSFDNGYGAHQKPGSSDTTRKSLSPLKAIITEEKGWQRNLQKYEVHPSTSALYRESPELHQNTSDNITEKYKDLSYKGSNKHHGASKVHSTGRRSYLGALSSEEKPELFSHNSTNISRLQSNGSSHLANHSDSGSDAYLYSDPELCFTTTSTSCPSQSSTSVVQRRAELSPLSPASSMAYKDSNKSKYLLDRLHDRIMVTTTIVDNYEYSGLQTSSMSPLSFSAKEYMRCAKNDSSNSNIPAARNP
uniref:ZZ-type domain-containing protein n=1 Tax=Trichobilharzia regenti TaxID=157069 RepID=A0AA85KD60_TRIRE|nr:unnamed protein product [Trichobilharzia regenti]